MKEDGLVIVFPEDGSQNQPTSPSLNFPFFMSYLRKQNKKKLIHDVLSPSSTEVMTSCVIFLLPQTAVGILPQACPSRG